MRKLNLLLPALLFFILTGCGTIKDLKKADYKPTPAYVNSSPRGANVYINGKLTGKTPLEAELKARGKEWPANWECEIKVEKDGYFPETRVVHLNEIQQYFELAKRKTKNESQAIEEKEAEAYIPREEKGSVKITSIPGRAEIYIDDFYIGNTPITNVKLVSSITHIISIRKTGYREWRRTLRVLTGSRQRIDAELEKE